MIAKKLYEFNCRKGLLFSANLRASSKGSKIFAVSLNGVKINSSLGLKVREFDQLGDLQPSAVLLWIAVVEPGDAVEHGHLVGVVWA